MLEGREVSYTCFIDKNGHVQVLRPARDHKWLYDKVTGGMFAYSPVPDFTPKVENMVIKTILNPTIRALADRGILYSGVLYIGLMITSTGIKALEFNCRFGDPELQVLLPRMKSDLVPYILACIDGTLDKLPAIRWDPRYAACAVAASKGYPKQYEIGKVIHGLDAVNFLRGTKAYHAGTAQLPDGTVVTHGGRVAGITALHRDLKAAIDMAYDGLERIQFKGKTFLPKDHVVF
jgi:phosphoribosylamine--glycine ligase